MAKRKRRKTKESNFQYSTELKGLFLVLVGLIGFGSFGIVGKFVKNFAIFMFGNWWALLLVIFVLLGAYMVAKRKMPDLLTSRLIGIYMIVIALLLFSHLNYLETESAKGMDIVKNTVDNIMVSVNNTELLRETGGGVIGALFAFVFVSLFGQTGTNVVVIVLTIFGIIMLFNITISDVFESMRERHEESKENRRNSRFEKKKKKLEEMEEEAEEENENVITISDLDELKSGNSVTNEGVLEPSSNNHYELPPLSLLKDSKVKKKTKEDASQIDTNSKIIEQTMLDFNIKGKVVDFHTGPTVTQYEVELSAGTKINKVLSINKELALNLAAKDIRIQAPIPGKHTVGIEIPNREPTPVCIKDIMMNIPKKYRSEKLIASLGKGIMGSTEVCNIAKMPHLLIAGSTGSGKSVCINGIIVSLIMRNTPDEVKLVLVDPKKVEFSMYEGIPHLLTPVVNNPKKASKALQNIVREMDNRYGLFSESGTKKIEDYNDLMRRKGGKTLPYIVVIIDELADLMVVARNEVEDSIMRITQLARAAGIHLIVATQRPSTNVITGVIKANIPSRISFAVSSQVDSRTILDASGAEKLLGKGDSLFWPIGASTPTRIQCSFIEDEEVVKVVKFWKNQAKAEYDESILADNPGDSVDASGNVTNVDDDDPLYNEIVEFAIKTGKISASLIQRKYHLGYNRAARIIDLLEERGIIGGPNGSKPREVLVKLDKEEKEE